MTDNTQDMILTQPKVPAYLPVIVALNDASFDVLSWPINSVQQRLKERIREVAHSEPEQSAEYLFQVLAWLNPIFAYDRKEISRQLRGMAAWVFEGRPLA